jgi:hypothetical protein
MGATERALGNGVLHIPGQLSGADSFRPAIVLGARVRECHR